MNLARLFLMLMMLHFYTNIHANQKLNFPKIVLQAVFYTGILLLSKYIQETYFPRKDQQIDCDEILNKIRDGKMRFLINTTEKK